MSKLFDGLKPKRYPSGSQWNQFFKILTRNEKIIFSLLLSLFLGSFFFILLNFYFENTKIVPARGGSYVEGLVGQPRFINPIYAQASDTDRALSELIFSGLMKHAGFKIVPDLAKDYKIKEKGRVYEVQLKDDIFWSDGKPLTAEDVVFTIETIQNPDYKSPIQALWLGVQVEKLSNSTIRFTLKKPYTPFLENLTQKIIPKHIWEGISPENFPLTTYNLKPIGSGPYKLKALKQNRQGKITSINLVRNPRYFGEPAKISQISFRFYDTEQEMQRAWQKGEIQGFSSSNLRIDQLSSGKLQIFHFSLPRYFAAFFNPNKSKVLSEKSVRQALNYGTNRQKLLKEVLLGQGKIVYSPLLPDIYGLSNPSENYQYNPEKAKDILKDAGFLEGESGYREKLLRAAATTKITRDLKEGARGKEVEELQKCLAQDPEVYADGTVSGFFGPKTKEAVIRFQEKYTKDILEPWGFKKGTGIVSTTTRNKLNELCFPDTSKTLPLKFSITTADLPLLVKTAKNLQEQWRALGADVELKIVDTSHLQRDVIKRRNYEIFLFGQGLEIIPDPLAFWHSTQIRDPGLNLAFYQQKTADRLLEEIRTINDQKQLKKSMEKLQDTILAEAPAVFLFNPDYLYFVSKEIKGIEAGIITDPSKRFSQITEWYIKTKRVWK